MPLPLPRSQRSRMLTVVYLRQEAASYRLLGFFVCFFCFFSLSSLFFIYSCNANIKKKNGKGLSAYDLALKTGNEEIISLFASKLGQGMLDKLTKPKNISLAMA